MHTRVCHTAVRDWSKCSDCILHRTRRRVALRRDSEHRSRVHVLFIGEAPGQVEDALGIPFTGPSGKVLNYVIKYVKFPFSYTITNAVNCRPVTVIPLDTDAEKKFYEEGLENLELGSDYELVDWNRDPWDSEIKACSDHVQELIDEVQPTAIILLGQIAKKACPKTKLPTLNLLHPAFILRKELKLLTVKRQARKLEKFLEKIGGIE